MQHLIKITPTQLRIGVLFYNHFGGLKSVLSIYAINIIIKESQLNKLIKNVAPNSALSLTIIISLGLYSTSWLYDSTEVMSSIDEAEDMLIRDGFVLQGDGSWYNEDRFLWAYVEPLEW